jgi:NADH-quinone oxidoreductase subunit L
MEGPTPVSALIHAATMVTAGVYMVARCHVLFDSSPVALTVVACIGAATALFAASIGMVQHDIKRVLAYSTISQLGYMYLACGVGAYAAGIFHLLTHSFFKALLFLAAGSVIHALSGEQDMRRMGGLRTRTPITFWTMSAGVFAIAGIPPFSGFFSKDEILYHTFASSNPLHIVLWLIGLATAGMTSFYMFRLWFKTFFGEPRIEQNATVESRGAKGIHESPWIMLLPLCILALLSVAGGWIGIPEAMFGSNRIEHFLDPVFANGATTEAATAMEAAVATTGHGLELILAVVSVLVAVAGFYIAYVFYYEKPGTAAALAERNRRAYNMVKNKYWVDEFYHNFLITPLLMFTRGIFELVFERGVVNGSGRAAGATTRGMAWLTRKQISGNIRSYAGWLAIGAAAVIAVMLFGNSLWGHL